MKFLYIFINILAVEQQQNIIFFCWKKTKAKNKKQNTNFLFTNKMFFDQLLVYKFSTSAGNLDGFLRKTFKNFDKTFIEFRWYTVEFFLDDVFVNIGVSESFVSILPFVIVKRRFCSLRICSLIRICFNVPANKSSTLSLIAADVSTNLQSYLNAAWRATK